MFPNSDNSLISFNVIQGTFSAEKPGQVRCQPLLQSSASPGESIQQIFEVHSTLLCEILVTPEITSSVNTIIQLILAPDSQPLSNEAHQQQPAAVLENYSQGKWKSSKLFHFYNRKSEYLMEVVSASLKWCESGTKVAQNRPVLQCQCCGQSLQVWWITDNVFYE